MPDRFDNLTWGQRRELALELWLDDHLRALGAVEPEDVDEPGGLAAIETRARLVADAAARLRRLRGEDLRDETDVAAFAAQLDRLA